MKVPRSSHSLLVMIRLFTRATISSTIAARAGEAAAASARRSAASPRARFGTGMRGVRAVQPGERWDRGVSPGVVAHVVERQDGAVDTDLRLFPQVRDEAVERLLAFRLEDLHADAALDLIQIGVLLLDLADELEHQVALRVLQHLADLAGLQVQERLAQLDRQILFAVHARLTAVRGDRVLPGQGLEARRV